MKLPTHCCASTRSNPLRKMSTSTAHLLPCSRTTRLIYLVIHTYLLNICWTLAELLSVTGSGEGNLAAQTAAPVTRPWIGGRSWMD